MLFSIELTERVRSENLQPEVLPRQQLAIQED